MLKRTRNSGWVFHHATFPAPPIVVVVQPDANQEASRVGVDTVATAWYAVRCVHFMPVLLPQPTLPQQPTSWEAILAEGGLESTHQLYMFQSTALSVWVFHHATFPAPPIVVVVQPDACQEALSVKVMLSSSMDCSCAHTPSL